MAKLKILSGRIEEPYTVPTPSLGINKALNGGLKSRTINIFWGPKASGKTTIGLHIIGAAQKAGHKCVYVDAEKTYSPVWAEKCGVNIDELAYCAGNSVEDITDTLIKDIAAGKYHVILIDSLSSIFVDSYLDTDSNGIGISARSQNTLMAKMLNALTPETMVIAIAHANMAQAGQGMIPAAKISKSVEHWASTILKIRQALGKDDRKGNAIRVTWELQKSKQSLYPMEGEYWFDTDHVAFDNILEIARLAIDNELVQVAGAGWITIGDQKVQGEENFANLLLSSQQLRDALRTRLGV